MGRAVRGILVLVLSIFVFQAAAMAYGGDLGYMARDKRPIKVYISEITEEPDQARVEPEAFKAELAKAFNNRRSVSFQVVDNPQQSDVIVSGVITHYQYLHRGPLKPSPGVAIMVADAAASAMHNYVDMTVNFTINDSKTGQVLWNKTINRYVKQDMTPDQSIPVIYDKIARALVSKSFGKGQR